ncbi:RidA family protein [Candidatus Nitronereus thalassa]|uniref:RidA family protein n=1 Tax=Candidatus Nitronereus thalassa TaxID=3020898 RepID=A0ABU3K3X3_9BACT|nr:RidA family protein [Candidatus Nitronereus thalassa]MDT7041088.1 RidA family protein [Candidatus Nitronereus thalassa]
MSYEQRLTQLGLNLPSAPKPVATYVPFVRVGDLLFLSGVVPIRDGKITHQGKLGGDFTKEIGYEATKITLLNALANVRLALGSLDRVKQVVKLTGYVASEKGFVEQPFVINGASDLLVEIFGDVGRHARVAVGVAELPLGVPVELELIVEVYPASV